MKDKDLGLLWWREKREKGQTHTQNTTTKGKLQEDWLSFCGKSTGSRDQSTRCTRCKRQGAPQSPTVVYPLLHHHIIMIYCFSVGSTHKAEIVMIWLHVQGKHYHVRRDVSTLLQDFGQMGATSAKVFPSWGGGCICVCVWGGNDSCLRL